MIIRKSWKDSMEDWYDQQVEETVAQWSFIWIDGAGTTWTSEQLEELVALSANMAGSPASGGIKADQPKETALPANHALGRVWK